MPKPAPDKQQDKKGEESYVQTHPSDISPGPVEKRGKGAGQIQKTSGGRSKVAWKRAGVSVAIGSDDSGGGSNPTITHLPQGSMSVNTREEE